MAAATRVVVLDALEPQMRGYLVEALKQPIAVNRATSGGGVMWGVLLLIVGFIAVAMHLSNLENGSPGGDFYSPVMFAIAASVAFVVGALIIGGVQRSRSLRRLPQQGTYAVGTNLVIATERVHTVYSFAQLEKLAVVSSPGRSGGLILIVRIAGITWNFSYDDKRTAFEVEQHILRNIAAMDQAFLVADSLAVMALDPYSYIVPQTVAAKRPVNRWLLALPVAATSLPIMYGIDFMADENAYHQCDDTVDSYRCGRYLRRGGRHDAELRQRTCEFEIAKARSVAEVQRVAGMCPQSKATADARIKALDGGGGGW